MSKMRNGPGEKKLEKSGQDENVIDLDGFKED